MASNAAVVAAASAPTTSEFEVRELYRIVGFLERQLNERNVEFKKAQIDNAAVRAQCDAASDEILAIKRCVFRYMFLLEYFVHLHTHTYI